MDINATLLGQMLVFGVLIWFSWKFIWPPLTKAIEDRHTTKREGIAAATEELLALLAKNGVSYGEFVFGVGAEEAVR